MKDKAVLPICLSIIIGFSILSMTIYILNRDNVNRYEMITPNESNIIIFDSKTGEYWRKFIEVGEGPTDWTKEESIDFSEK